jgi:hypothetical protein
VLSVDRIETTAHNTTRIYGEQIYVTAFANDVRGAFETAIGQYRNLTLTWAEMSYANPPQVDWYRNIPPIPYTVLTQGQLTLIDFGIVPNDFSWWLEFAEVPPPFLKYVPPIPITTGWWTNY